VREANRAQDDEQGRAVEAAARAVAAAREAGIAKQAELQRSEQRLAALENEVCNFGGLGSFWRGKGVWARLRFSVIEGGGGGQRGREREGEREGGGYRCRGPRGGDCRQAELQRSEQRLAALQNEVRHMFG
jgi:hypothetical protein